MSLLTNNYCPPSAILSDNVYTKSIINEVKIYNDGDVFAQNIVGTYTNWKYSVRWVSFENLALQGAYQDLESTYGDRILVVAQDDPIQNGIYVISSDTWERAYDMKEGSNAAGSFIVASEQPVVYIYTCTNMYPDDIVGTYELVFERGIANNVPGGVQGSVQYKNESYNSFEGSSSLVFETDDDALTTTLSIGDSVYPIYMIPGPSDTFTKGVNMNITTKDISADVASGSITLKAGNGASTLSQNGSINIVANNGTISTFLGSEINFTTGNSNRESNIEITCNNLTLSTDNGTADCGLINFETSDIDLQVKKGGLLMTKSTDTVLYPLGNVTTDSKQGTITISGLVAIGPSSSGTFQIINGSATATSVVLVNLLSYSGTGSPLIKVSNTISDAITVKIINISNVLPLSDELTMGFIIL